MLIYLLDSIADHMYRMAMLCMLIPIQTAERPLDIGRCVQVRYGSSIPFERPNKSPVDGPRP